MEYVGMNILGRLLKTRQGNQFVIVTTDSYTKLMEAISTQKTNATAITRIFSEHWVASFEIPPKRLTDNSPIRV